MTEIVRLYSRAGEEMEAQADIGPDGRLIRGDEGVAEIAVKFLEERSVDELLNYLDGPHLMAMAIDVDDLDYDPGVQEKMGGGRATYKTQHVPHSTLIENTEKTHWLTEPRLGKVGWYDSDTGAFLYRGASACVSGLLKESRLDALEDTRTSLVARQAASNLLKQDDDKWIPYKGPQGGEGWQQVGSGEVRYQQEPPGEVVEEHDVDHWKQRWPEIEGAEWNEEVPSPIDMKEEDALLFVNRNGESEVGRFESATFIRDENWDSAKSGVVLQDGRKVLTDDIEAHADMTKVVEPPALHGDGVEWGDAPGSYNDYEPWNLVHFIDSEGEETVGIVESYAKDRGALKVQTSERFTVVEPDKVTHYAETPRYYNTGYEALRTPFDTVPSVPENGEPPTEGFASRYGATTEDVRGAFSQIFGLHLVDNLEQTIQEGDYDPDDPDDILEAIVDYRGDSEQDVYETLKKEIRGRSVGLGKRRIERILGEAFGMDIGDPSYEIGQIMDGEADRQDPEAWLEYAAQWAAIEEDWVSLQSLQEAVDDWSGTVPLSVSGLHGFDGEPDETVALSETGENAGISAGAMFISEWSNGDKAYITRIRDREEHGHFNSQFMESSVEAERAMTGFGVQSEFAEDNDSVQIPDHEYFHDSHFSVASAPDSAVLANDFLDEHQSKDLELPNGFPEDEIAERLGADVEDVIEAFGDTVYPGWENDEETNEIFENDNNLNRENPKDWVAVAKERYDNPKASTWNAFAEKLSEETYQSTVEKDDFLDMSFGAIIAGNKDLHVNNVMADEDGTLYPIDLDFAGYDMTQSHELGQAVGKLASTARSLGIEASEEYQEKGDPNAFDDAETPLGQEILAYVNETADSQTVEQARSGNPMWRDGGADEVARNAEAAKNGELKL